MNTINIIVNNQPQTIPENTSLATFLNEGTYDSECIAVAINTYFIPRDTYANTLLKADDQIDIVSPIQGG